MAWTKEQKTRWQREYRKKTGNAYTRKYEKSPRGFLMRAYRNMLSRVSGVQTKKMHLYFGLPLMPKEQFYEWASRDAQFWVLYKQWVAQGYPRKLTPSVNRIDSSKGYELGNVEWITHSLNSAIGAKMPRRNISLGRLARGAVTREEQNAADTILSLCNH